MSRLSVRSLVILLVLAVSILIYLLSFLSRQLGLDVPTVLVVVIASLTAVIALIAVVKFRKARALVARNLEAVNLLNQGEVGDALASFEACEREAKQGSFRQLQPLFALNRAVAMMRQSRCEEAVVLCREILAHPSAARHFGAQWGHLVAVSATAELLLPEPNVAAAQTLIDDGWAKTPRAQQAPLFAPRCNLLIRAGKFAEVDTLLSERWAEADGVLRARELRLLQLLWAFALHSHGRTDDARARSRDVGEQVLEEQAVMLKHWPTLAAFVSALSDYRQPTA